LRRKKIEKTRKEKEEEKNVGKVYGVKFLRERELSRFFILVGENVVFLVDSYFLFFFG